MAEVNEDRQIRPLDEGDEVEIVGLDVWDDDTYVNNVGVIERVFRDAPVTVRVRFDNALLADGSTYSERVTYPAHSVAVVEGCAI